MTCTDAMMKHGGGEVSSKKTYNQVQVKQVGFFARETISLTKTAC